MKSVAGSFVVCSNKWLLCFVSEIDFVDESAAKF
jgi:hypothetical protein